MSSLTVSASISAPLALVWDAYTTPEHIMGWNFADPTWHCPRAKSDFRVGGIFSYTMAARDGSASFEYSGIFTAIEPWNTIQYTLGEMPEFDLDAGRKVGITFAEENDAVTVTVIFDTENIHSEELQREGWQSILDNFKNYVESF